VLAEQARQGSAGSYAKFLDPAAAPGNRLGPAEAAFVAQRDGFYHATVSETGWPYVQFRGGPRGFLKVLDEGTLAYADFRGNRQYLSVGNLKGDDRVALILVDYPNRRRLKVWGHARIVDAAEDPALVAQLHDPAYQARPERAVVIAVAALDWNCPQHLPQRYTLEELEPALSQLRAELQRLQAENAALRGETAPQA
jgi:predicted pyridoxine 5'-phosphate oxidase superfamily flavin-nucleotide-binding protein